MLQSTLAKPRLWSILAAVALVMVSTVAGSGAPAGQGGRAEPSLANGQAVDATGEGDRPVVDYEAATKAVASFSNNLVAHWQFDEQGGTEALDSSGHGNHGTLHDFPRYTSQWVTGRMGGALSFNTDAWSNNVVVVADSGSLNFSKRQGFTLAVWVKAQRSQAEHAGILCKGWGMGGEQYGLDVFEGRFRFLARPARSNPRVILISAVSPNGRWQHLAATLDARAQLMALYVDGQLAGSQPAPLSLLDTAHEVSLGSRKYSEHSGYNLPFKGIIDEVRIYDRALSALEARALYDAAGPWPVRICRQPNGAERHMGEKVVFSIEADGLGWLEYQWQKNGRDIPGAITPALELSNLAFEDAGVYTVKVMDLNGAAISENAVLTMVPYFWQSRWFLALVVPLLLLGVSGTVYLVQKRQARLAVERLERAHEIDRERMRIARDMHDQIGSKLSRLALLSDMARQGVEETSTVRKQIDEVSEAARGIVQSVDEIVWAVNPRHDTLESLVHYIRGHAEEFFEMTPVELEFEQLDGLPAAQLSAETRHNLFCAVKEVLNNVLKHAAATRVRISFHPGEAAFQITISDNGRGFDLQAVSSAGNGLFNMRERLKSVHGECAMESQPGQGTVVTLKAPLTEAAAQDADHG